MTNIEPECKAMSNRESPKIVVTAADHARLTVLARAAINRMPDLSRSLSDELDIAEIVPGRRPQGVVCMGSDVEFRDDISGKIRRVTLVYPDAADISARRVSVLTPVGTALLGTRTGDCVEWETPSGEWRSLTIVDVREPATGG